jgi:ATP-dependent protease ClpP protease subunit
MTAEQAVAYGMIDEIIERRHAGAIVRKDAAESVPV